MKRLIFLVLIFGGLHEAAACIQLPKSIALSETSFAGVIDIGFTTNCKVSFSLSNGSVGKSISIEDGQLCISIRPTDGETKKVCGADLAIGSKHADAREALELRNSEGVIVGKIVKMRSGFTIQSVDSSGKPAPDKPHLQFETHSSDWTVSAFQNSTEKIGELQAKSGACTRSLGGAPVGQGVLDLRGKSVVPDSEPGCHSGLLSSEYKAKGAAVFTLDGDVVGK